MIGYSHPPLKPAPCHLVVQGARERAACGLGSGLLGARACRAVEELLATRSTGHGFRLFFSAAETSDEQVRLAPSSQLNKRTPATDVCGAEPRILARACFAVLGMVTRAGVFCVVPSGKPGFHRPCVCSGG